MDSMPNELKDVLYDLGRCIEALDRHTESVVLTGGLAVLLYRWLLPGAVANQPPLTTFDIDWAVPQKIPSHGVGIDEALRGAKFVARLSGAEAAPVTRYHHERHGTHRPAPVHVEFVAPRHGAKTSRKGENQGIVEVQHGLHAQTDPYLGLLFVENVIGDAAKVPALGLSEARPIRLPNPISLVLQKILIRKRRRQQKKDNDAAHIYDIALMTRPLWPELRKTLERIEDGEQFPKKWFARARQTLAEVFATPTAPGPVGVARILRSASGETSPPTEEAIYRVLRHFLKEVGLSED